MYLSVSCDELFAIIFIVLYVGPALGNDYTHSSREHFIILSIFLILDFVALFFIFVLFYFFTLGKSGIHGFGIFAKHPHRAGDMVK